MELREGIVEALQLAESRLPWVDYDLAVADESLQLRIREKLKVAHADKQREADVHQKPFEDKCKALDVRGGWCAVYCAGAGKGQVSSLSVLWAEAPIAAFSIWY